MVEPENGYTLYYGTVNRAVLRIRCLFDPWTRIQDPEYQKPKIGKKLQLKIFLTAITLTPTVQ